MRKQHGSPIAPADCLVIEDSKEGIRGARRAGMKCLAVTNSHPAELLRKPTPSCESLKKSHLPFFATDLRLISVSTVIDTGVVCGRTVISTGQQVGGEVST